MSAEGAVQVATIAILLATLIVTARMAKAAGQEARAAADQVALQRRQAALGEVAGIRPLLSVQRLAIQWVSGIARTCAIEISNAGGGPCYNIECRVDGLASAWSVDWASAGSQDCYGAMASGDRRRLIATALGSSDVRSAFSNTLVVVITCRDVLLNEYQFQHVFSTRPSVEYALELGVRVTSTPAAVSS